MDGFKKEARPEPKLAGGPFCRSCRGSNVCCATAAHLCYSPTDHLLLEDGTARKRVSWIRSQPDLPVPRVVTRRPNTLHRSSRPDVWGSPDKPLRHPVLCPCGLPARPTFSVYPNSDRNSKDGQKIIHALRGKLMLNTPVSRADSCVAGRPPWPGRSLVVNGSAFQSHEGYALAGRF